MTFLYFEVLHSNQPKLIYFTFLKKFIEISIRKSDFYIIEYFNRLVMSFVGIDPKGF